MNGNSFYGPVFTFDECSELLIKNLPTLTAKVGAAVEIWDFEIEFDIHFDKEESKDEDIESGVSDGSDEEFPWLTVEIFCTILSILMK